jgi:hypothetical protein
MIFFQLRLPATFLVLSLSLVGCLQTENSSSGDGLAPVGTPAFIAASEVFDNKCSQCHDYHTLSEAELITLGLVMAGDPEGSEIYYRNTGSLGVNGPKNMPFVGSLTAGELMLIYDWILAI